ncbi:importin-5-like [Teleopsis dalmanni]|uniref:importin-5-like n=1 Tax=Teleopsis dalmanni TaxID=139649 RepID=UPI0018CF6F69|nr:importin-5-like [Teleopsis dalmanni]
MAANEKKLLGRYKNKVIYTLHLLIANDTNSRNKVEECFHKMRLEWRCHALFSIMADTRQGREYREMSIRVLEACFTINCFSLVYSALSVSAQEEVLKNLVSSGNVAVSRTFSKCWGEIITQAVECLSEEDEDYKWPALNALLLDWSTHNSVYTIHTCMRTFASVLFIFNAYDTPVFLNNIRKSIKSCLSERNSSTVRRAATLAVFDFVRLMSTHDNLSEKVIAQFSDFVPKLITIVKGTIKFGRSRKLFQCLVKTVKECSNFFSNHIETLLSISFHVLTSINLEALWNYLALEIVITIIEKFTPIVENLYIEYVLYLLPILMDMAEIVEDDDEWHECDENFDEDPFEPRKVALTCFHRLFKALGEKILFQPLLQTITAKKYRMSWKGVHTIIGVATTIVRSFQVQHAPPRSEQFAYSLMFYLQHDHPRLRYCVCDLINALGSHREIIESRFFQNRLIPMMRDIIKYENVPRVSHKAMQTMTLIIEEAPFVAINVFAEEYVELIEKSLKRLTKSLELEGKVLILEGLLTALGAFATKCNKSVHSNYKQILDIILSIFKVATGDRMWSLRAACFECAGKIISTLNKKQLKNDIDHIMETFIDVMTKTNFVYYDIEVVKLMSAFTDICSTIGKKFKKYIPTIMRCFNQWDIIGPIDEILSKMTDSDFYAELDDIIAIKLTACQMFTVFGTALKADFAPYAEQIVPMVHSLFSCDYYSADMFAYLAVPKLLRCFRAEDLTLAMDVWIRMQGEIINFIIRKMDLRTQLNLLPNLSLCFNIMQNSSYQGIAFQTLLDFIDSKITFYINKTIDPQFRSNCSSYINNIVTTDTSDPLVLQSIIPHSLSLLRALFGTYGNNVLEKIDQLNPHFVTIFNNEQCPIDIRYILEVYMDAIKCCSHKCLPYIHLFTDKLPGYLIGGCPAIVRQGAIIACGVIAQYAGISVASLCKTYMELLLSIITSRNKLTDEEAALNIFDNAMASIARILQFNCSAIPYTKEAFKCWFDYMPITQEQRECEYCINFICDLLDAKHVYVSECRTVTKVFKIFADAFRYDVIEPRSQDGTRILCYIRHIEESIDTYAACMATLNFDQQDALRLANSKFNNNAF